MKKISTLLAFIEAYRNLPELWDLQCPTYSNRVKKAAAYEVLIEKLKPLEPDATRNSVVKKINNLRTTFRKELKKMNDSKKEGKDGDPEYFPSLWYFNDLMFLVNQGTPDPCESTLVIKTEVDSGLVIENGMLPPPSSSYPILSNESELPPKKENTKDLNATKIDAPRLRITKTVSLSETQRKINDSLDSSADYVLNKRSVEEDECDVYAKLLAKRLRKYPERMRDRIMYKIDGLLLENPPDECVN